MTNNITSWTIKPSLLIIAVESYRVFKVKYFNHSKPSIATSELSTKNAIESPELSALALLLLLNQQLAKKHIPPIAKPYSVNPSISVQKVSSGTFVPAIAIEAIPNRPTTIPIQAIAKM